MTEKVSVNIIRCFEGKRQERLRFLWDVTAEYAKTRMVLHWHANPALANHATCLAAMWEAECARPNRYALITEHDFLPDLKNFLPTALLSEDEPILAARYVTRNAQTRKLEGHNAVGPWFMLIDKEHAPRDLHFEPWGIFNDPANGLNHFLQADHKKQVRFLSFKDSMPLHYGCSMPTGEHLFWARHLHDHENIRISGVCMGDMQRNHDAAVMRWVRETPLVYRRLLRARLEQVQALAGSDDNPPQAGLLHPADCSAIEPLCEGD